MKRHDLSIGLIDPQIPQNTGNIARMCAATNTKLQVVGNIGFSLSDKYLKRAGLDYWPLVNWEYIEETEKYFKSLNPEKIHLLTTKSTHSYTKREFKPNDTILFGSETKGLDAYFLEKYKDRCCTIPMENPGVRSLNLASSAGIVLFEALRQING